MVYLGYVLVLLHDLPLYTVADIRAWLKKVNAGELLAHPALPATLLEKLPVQFKYFESACRLLEQWEARYFRNSDPVIVTGLEREAREACLRVEADRQKQLDLIESLTEGLRLDEAEKLERVILVPQYHGRPANILEYYDNLFLGLYPVDVLPPAPGEPSPALLRLTAALADTNRLKVLKYLSHDEQSFSDIVKHLGLAKSTVHYHLILLRAAGLVRAHFKGGDCMLYGLRRQALEETSARLARYISL
jgi:DNA-binding transcriptional ArsR family regulator